MDITKAFLKSINNCIELNEAIDIVRENSSGNIWLIGGFVYRSIASQLYDCKKPDVDIDFIVENHNTRFALPFGWIASTNRFGNTKFVHHQNGWEKSIDYVPLSNTYSIRYRALEPTIENYLDGVPLNIQSIAYDVDNNMIIGDIGMDALKKRIVAVHDLYFAEYAVKKSMEPQITSNPAKKKFHNVNEMIKDKADSLGFKAKYVY